MAQQEVRHRDTLLCQTKLLPTTSAKTNLLYEDEIRLEQVHELEVGANQPVLRAGKYILLPRMTVEPADILHNTQTRTRCYA
jgi:hypothetical protein